MPPKSPFDLKVEHESLSRLHPHAHNARTHSKRQIDQIAKSIVRFGFNNPILVDDDFTILAGHGRAEAARSLGIEAVPIVRLSHLSAAEKRAYVIADNRLAEKSGWDKEILAIELQNLIELEFETEAIGFETAEVDLIIGAASEADPNGPNGQEDAPPPAPQTPTCQLGDIWVLGRHRLICGNARAEQTYTRLLGADMADLLFTDPPYNVAINGHVSGKGKIKHSEFSEASGDLNSKDFEAFLTEALTASSARLKSGAIAFVFMDWRHMGEVLQAGAAAFDSLQNLCVWAKTNAGMGSLYRSQHELVFVFKKDSAPHTNNIELGRHGRNRSNVWTYSGCNGFGVERAQALSLHPTVKPVALIEDAIKDTTKRGAIVLDGFGGSGSTLIAAEKCGRTSRLIETSPAYCDVILNRFEAFTGREAVLQGDGRPFSLIGSERSLASPAPAKGGA